MYIHDIATTLYWTIIIGSLLDYYCAKLLGYSDYLE